MKNLKGGKFKSPIVLEARPRETKELQPELKIGPISTLNLFLNPFKERYGKYYRENKLHIIFDLTLVLAILILLVINFRLWLPGFWGPADVINLEIKIGPTPITSGGPINYTISYLNKSKKLLKNVSLVMRLPQGFQTEKFVPDSFDEKTHTLKIGELEAGANGELKIYGRILNPVGDYQKIIALLNYTDENGLANQEIFSSSYLVEASVIEANLELPNQISNYSEFKANLSIKNNSDQNFEKVKLVVKWPREFIFFESEIKPNNGNNEWLFNKINAGETKNFKVTGKISSQETKPLSIETELYINERGQYLIQDKKTISIPLIFSKLSLEFEEKEKNENISPGNEMTYKISYKNNEKYNLQNLNLALKIESEFIDWEYLKKNYKINENKIIWNKNRIRQLENLESGGEGKIEITIKTLPTIKFEKIQEGGFKINATIEGNYFNPETGQTIFAESNPLETKINSSLKINSFALYYTKEGDQLGLGPIPPQVGKTTKYWLFLQIHNTPNQVNNVEVIAHLPEGVEMTGKSNVTEGNNLEFNPQTRTIKWVLEKVSPYVPIFYPSPEARLEIAIKPTSQDQGKILTLLDQIKISGKDDFTGVNLENQGKEITTDIFENENLGKVK